MNKFQSKTNIKNFNTIFNLSFNKEYKKKFYVTFILMMSGMILELCGIGLIFPALQIITDQEFLIKVSKIFGIPNLEISNLLIFISIFFILFYGLKNFFLWIILRKYASFLAYYEAYLQSKIYNGYFKKSVYYFKHKNSSDIIVNIKEICSFFSSIYLNSLINLSLEIFLQISILLLLFFFNWQSTLLILILFGGLSVFLFSYHKNRLKELGQLRNELSKLQLRNVQDGIGGIKEIKLLGRELFFLKEFENNTKQLADANRENAVIAGTPRLVIEFFAICSVATMIILFLFLGKSILEILPTLGLFFVAAYKMIPSFNKILLLLTRVKFSSDGVNKILNLLNEIKFDKDLNDTKASQEIKFEKEINLSKISYKYPDRGYQILKDVNMKINKNTFVGISGESGSGKSTLIDIIMGIIRPNEGQILIDGVSIDVSIRDWQKKIGYVSQDIFLFPDTIRKNVAFGLPENEIDDKLLDEVIRKSSLQKFIDSLENGLNTNIGEGGALISGGQKQRIGIARALYNKPKLLIFDEATSALDISTEKEILNEIINLKKEFTLIFVSHKENSLKYCDKKYLLKNKILTEN